MSDKINIIGIIKEHFNTVLSDKYDKVVFIWIPIVLLAVAILLKTNISKETISLLVNFGSIFTALLLSLLVLIYDQESKIKEEKKKDNKFQEHCEEYYNLKISLSKQLYHNVSFSIISSIALVLLCLFHSVVETQKSLEDLNIYAITPMIIMVFASIIFNIIMILKRMHALLTTDD